MTKTFLGISLTRSTETDSDWIAVVRSQLRVQSGIRWFSIVLAFVCFAAGIGFPMWLSRIIASGDISPFEDAGFSGGFVAGFAFFSLSGFLVLAGVVELGLAVSFFKGYRTEKLLVKYYDKCQKECQPSPREYSKDADGLIENVQE